MNHEQIRNVKKEIEELGMKALKDYFGLDIQKVDPKLLNHIHQRARVAIQFEREMNISKRAVENNYLRVFRMIAEDKKEYRSLIKKSIPEYIPK
jgi:hypothetical protein